MGYRNAKFVLPPSLLEEVRNYAEGECLYIPRREQNSHRACPASLTERNLQIQKLYFSGVSVQELANRFFLSPQAIYKILSKFK